MENSLKIVEKLKTLWEQRCDQKIGKYTYEVAVKLVLEQTENKKEVLNLLSKQNWKQLNIIVG